MRSTYGLRIMSGPGSAFIFRATDCPLEMMPLPDRVMSEVTPPESATWIIGSSRSRFSTAFHSGVNGPGIMDRLDRSSAKCAWASIMPGMTTAAVYSTVPGGASTVRPTAWITPSCRRISPSRITPFVTV